MSDRIDFSSFRDNAPIITISLSGRDANICVFFSMNCCTKMFEHHEQGDDFRTAFAKAVFLMFQNTECNDGEGLTETDFLSAPDDSLLLVLNAILEQDNKLKNEYDKATGSSAYEQFFTANESILEASNPVPTPLLGHRCRSSQEITGSPTPFSTSNHYLWICASASFSLSNPNIAA